MFVTVQWCDLKITGTSIRRRRSRRKKEEEEMKEDEDEDTATTLMHGAANMGR